MRRSLNCRLVMCFIVFAVIALNLYFNVILVSLVLLPQNYLQQFRVEHENTRVDEKFFPKPLKIDHQEPIQPNNKRLNKDTRRKGVRRKRREQIVRNFPRIFSQFLSRKQPISPNHPNSVNVHQNFKTIEVDKLQSYYSCSVDSFIENRGKYGGCKFKNICLTEDGKWKLFLDKVAALSFYDVPLKKETRDFYDEDT